MGVLKSCGSHKISQTQEKNRKKRIRENTRFVRQQIEGEEDYRQKTLPCSTVYRRAVPYTATCRSLLLHISARSSGTQPSISSAGSPQLVMHTLQPWVTPDYYCGLLMTWRTGCPALHQLGRSMRRRARVGSCVLPNLRRHSNRML